MSAQLPSQGPAPSITFRVDEDSDVHDLVPNPFAYWIFTDDGGERWIHREGDQWVEGPPAPFTRNGITYSVEEGI